MVLVVAQDNSLLVKKAKKTKKEKTNQFDRPDDSNEGKSADKQEVGVDQQLFVALVADSIATTIVSNQIVLFVFLILSFFFYVLVTIRISRTSTNKGASLVFLRGVLCYSYII